MEVNGLWLTYKRVDEFALSKKKHDSNRREVPAEVMRDFYSQPIGFQGSPSHKHILTQPNFDSKCKRCCLKGHNHDGCCRCIREGQSAEKLKDRELEKQRELLKRRTSYDPQENSQLRNRDQNTSSPQRSISGVEVAKQLLKRRTSYNPMESSQMNKRSNSALPS
jgi:hypothetical protein